MSEFKFACPVCGQHITADSATSGSQVECPTCFRKIVVPPAPASPDSKLILSAAQVDTRRTSGLDMLAHKPKRGRPISLLVRIVLVVVVLTLVSFAAWLIRDNLLKLFARHPSDLQNTNTTSAPSEGWTLDLTNAPLQDSKVTGRILGVRFNCEKVTLEGGMLSFLQNPGLPSERRVTISLFAPRPERLADKTLEIPHDRTGPRPKVLLEVRHAWEAPSTRTLQEKYALRLEFDAIAEARLPGHIFLAVSDDEKSCINGRFDAQIITDAKEPSKPSTNAGPKP